MDHEQPKARPFGLRDKLGYLFGDFGNDFTFIFASSFLMVFYTKVLGINSAAVGVLFLAARFVDAVTDVTMGRIVDVCRPARDGRFRPWIRRMCGPVALSSFLMYQYALADAPTALKMAYMYVTYILWGSVFYTSINIPYGSMASVITGESPGRTALSTWRSMGAALASLIIGVGGPLILYVTDSQGNKVASGPRFTAVAGVFSLLAVVCYILCYKLTTERIQIEARGKKGPGPGRIAAALFTNRALLAIIAAAILLLLSQLMLTQMNNFLFADYFKNTAALSAVNVLSALATLALAPAVVPLTRRFGKKETGAVATLFAGLTYLALWLLRLRDPYAFVAVSAVGYLGVAYFNLIIWANITDVIDYQEVRSGSRDDGTVYAVYSFARKVGQALAGGLGGFALSAIGYDELAHAQTDAVKNGVYSVATLVPAVCFLAVSLVLALAYPLGRRAVEANTAALARRREEQK